MNLKLNNKPLISVIIPAYNQGQYLRFAIQSVITQPYQNVEVIIVDDGSTDNTRQVVESIHDNRIHYISQSNKGLPAARNTGILFSSGEYLAFLDSDDEFLPIKLELQSDFLTIHPEIGLVAGGYFFINKEGHILREERPWLSSPQLNLYSWLNGQPFVPAALLVKRNWVKTIDMFDESQKPGGEDWDFYLRLSYAGCEMRWLETPVCCYRIHQSNISKDHERIRNAGLLVFEKFFSNPNLADFLKSNKPRTLAHVYIDAAARGYAAGYYQDAMVSLQMAIDLDPSLIDGNPPLAYNTLVSWALRPYVADSKTYLFAILNNLPENAITLHYSRRKMFGLYQAIIAFESYQYQQYGRVVKHALFAIMNDTRMFNNRGLLSIIFRSLWYIAKKCFGYQNKQKNAPPYLSISSS